jgi:hypothetical protein
MTLRGLVCRAFHASTLTMCAALFAVTAVEAATPGSRWTSIDLGFAGATGSLVRGGVAGGISVAMRTTEPIVRHLRSSLEVRGDLFSGAGFAGSSIPEETLIAYPSTAATVLAGFELEGPVRGHSGPFAGVSAGITHAAVGDVRSEYHGGLVPLASITHGERRFSAAFGAEVGFHRLPTEAGTDPELCLRYLGIWNDEAPSHIFSASLGLGF